MQSLEPDGEQREDLFEVEVLDGELVAPGAALTPRRAAERGLLRVSQPALQTAAAAATGFVAGAATVALLRRYAGRALRDPELLADVAGRRHGHPSLRRGATYIVHIRPLAAPPE